MYIFCFALLIVGLVGMRLAQEPHTMKFMLTYSALAVVFLTAAACVVSVVFPTPTQLIP
jgi:hypothetical protein